LQARGANDPVAAVDQLLRAAVSLDVKRAIELLPPDEGRVLRDYSPLFLDDAKKAAADSGFHADVKALELTADRSGSHATVTLERLEIAFTSGQDSGTVAYDGKCVTFTGPNMAPGDGKVCPDDATGPRELTGIASRLPGQGIVAVERDGQWFVSPTRTVLEAVVGALKALQPSDLDGLRDFFKGEQVNVGGTTVGGA
jgi:hypothetical protein